MDNLKKILEVLNDLIRINKDREAGYTKASRELTPAEHNLRSAFERKALESRSNVMQLESMADEIHHQLNPEEPIELEVNPGMTGRIYKMWTEVKDFFFGMDNSTILRSFVDGEEKAKTCYENALNEVQMPEEICTLLNNQKSSIDASQQEIKSLLNSEFK
ncbi:MAG TPA: PA2169 family four-helix-bundle protein [Chitinophagaceae bacterium]|nr:PA2169 family four-helix-bundle protein [Chitinophagaceae bacterium]